MSGSLKVTKTDYFTYITDGNTEISFRAKDQTWNCSLQGINYAIHVSGPNVQPGFAGAYNAFAKKHLLTVAGGGREGSSYQAALAALETGNRVRNHTLLNAFNGDVTSKLSAIHNNRQHGSLHDHANKRADKHADFDATSQAQYQIHSLGMQSQDVTVPLTMVLCDRLSPEDLKQAFAGAIAKERKRTGAGTGATLRGPGNHGVPVIFDVPCVYQHDDVRNVFTTGDRIRVTIYLENCTDTDVTAHVVHCHGT